MPITKQAIKKMRSDRGRERRNAKVRVVTRDAVKLARKSPNAKNLKQAFSLLDKATKAGVYHPNKVARLKSRLSKLTSKK
ncbi:30S ribosomal protein S20 [Candidatus Gottesmanbacteria bacterium]|nr:30S ribosomal protein S20 [Candidatus Gottesmanbacteria bacterium]